MKCEICGAISNERIKPFHKFECSENKLNQEQWEAENDARNKKLVDFLMKMMENSNIVEKMSYAQIRDYLIRMSGKLDINSLDAYVLDRAVDIIENYEKEFFVFSA